MNLKDSLLHLVFEEDKPKETPPPDQTPSAQPTSIIPTPQLRLPNISSSTQIDTNIEQTLNEALISEKKNNAGFDYFNLKDVLKTLPTTMDEKTRYEAANAMAATMNATPDSLISSANKYLTTLQNEEQSFKEILQQQYEQTVTAKEKEIQTIDEVIKSKSEEITRLTTEISECQKQKQLFSDSIVDEKGKIEKTQNAFYATYTSFLNKIQDDIKKISLYLGGTNAN